MTLSGHYPIKENHNCTVFRFESIGEQGIIQKWIWFQDAGENRFNLAFGDFVDGKPSDSVISNNFDLIKVMSTIAFAVYRFFEVYPEVSLIIEAVDDKRLRLYNTIFQRKFDEIRERFSIRGIAADLDESYQPEKSYRKFELRLKSS